MEPIIVKSQLSFENYYKINLNIFWRKIRWILGFMAIGILLVFITTDTKDEASTFTWIGGFLVVYALLIPLFNYFTVKRVYKKIKSMSESKTYEFDEINVELSGPTISATMDWSVIEKVKENKGDFIAFVSAGKGVHFLPKNGFENNDDINSFKTLIKSKGIKNNFKN